MNKLLLLPIYLLFQSCSTHTIMHKTDDKARDVLANESLLRYGQHRTKLLSQSFKSRFNGAIQCHQGHIKMGLQLLKEKYQSSRSDPEYWNQIGNCYYLDLQYQKADYYYQLSQNITKLGGQNNPAAFNNRGVIYLKFGHYQMAYNSFSKAIEQNRNLLTPIFNMAQLQIKFGLLDTALISLHRLEKLAPNDTDVIASLGITYLMKSNIKKSLQYFQKIEPDNQVRQDIATHYSLALYLVKEYKLVLLVINKVYGRLILELKVLL